MNRVNQDSGTEPGSVRLFREVMGRARMGEAERDQLTEALRSLLTRIAAALGCGTENLASLAEAAERKAEECRSLKRERTVARGKATRLRAELDAERWRNEGLRKRYIPTDGFVVQVARMVGCDFLPRNVPATQPELEHLSRLVADVVRSRDDLASRAERLGDEIRAGRREWSDRCRQAEIEIANTRREAARVASFEGIIRSLIGIDPGVMSPEAFAEAVRCYAEQHRVMAARIATGRVPPLLPERPEGEPPTRPAGDGRPVVVGEPGPPVAESPATDTDPAPPDCFETFAVDAGASRS